MAKKIGFSDLESKFEKLLTPFQSTNEIIPLQEMIGQNRAVKAVEFGLSVKKTGYNVFVSGAPGTGKITYIKNYTNRLAKKEETPEDWIYVHNFQMADQPMAINLPPGEGRNFSKKMDQLIEEVQAEIKKTFEGEDYERQKSDLLKKYKDKQQSIMSQLDQSAREKGFIIQKKSTGIFTIPAKDGQPMKQEDYDQLSKEEKDRLSQVSQEVQEEVSDAMRQVRQIDREAKKALQDLDKNIAHMAVDDPINELKEENSQYEKLVKYLEAVREDIIENIDDFKEGDEEEPQLPFLSRRQEDPRRKYRVNLFIDNSELEGAPVIQESNPTYTNLTGKAEYRNRMGTMETEFTLLKPGSLHQANGGYLIIQARDILSHYQAWDALKRSLKNQRVKIENIGEHLGYMTMATLKPEAIPLRVKVILIGSPLFYNILYHYDEDFGKLFKIKADFDIEMEADRENVNKLASFIATHCHQEDLLHFNREGVIAIAEYSSRIASHHGRLSTRFNELVEIIYEAETYARQEGKKIVDQQDVQKAIKEKTYRFNRVESKLHTMIEEGTLLFDFDQEKVGQINGLSVSNMGDYQFGHPVKITANTFLGKAGIVNIEREVKMSGQIHSKGVLILSGYLGYRYAQDTPLSLSASLTFEQMYSGIEGDSASAAELFALLSSLSQTPIQQNFAVTGSVNQKGEIQPVGGITEKVEGFFNATRVRGIKEGAAVIIPEANRKNLLLSEEVKEAIAEDKFSIHSIKTVDEGIELLTGEKAGKINSKGHYPRGTINLKVQEKLREMARYHEKQKELTGEEEEEDQE